jgi:hypothetical protein
MGTLTMLALRTVLALVLAGSVFVQVVMVPLLAIDLDELNPDHAYLRTPLVVFAVLGIVSIQVVLVCVWRLLTMVRRGTVFSDAAFRYVDVVIGAIATGSVLVFGIALVGAYANRTAPGDEIAPGMVGLICGFSLVVAGVALVVLVMRMLLAQAVALDSEAKHLQAELDEVI